MRTSRIFLSECRQLLTWQYHLWISIIAMFSDQEMFCTKRILMVPRLFICAAKLQIYVHNSVGLIPTQYMYIKKQIFATFQGRISHLQISHSDAQKQNTEGYYVKWLQYPIIIVFPSCYLYQTGYPCYAPRLLKPIQK